MDQYLESRKKRLEHLSKLKTSTSTRTVTAVPKHLNEDGEDTKRNESRDAKGDDIEKLGEDLNSSQNIKSKSEEILRIAKEELHQKTEQALKRMLRKRLFETMSSGE